MNATEALTAALTGTVTKIAATDVAMSANMVGTRCRALGLKCIASSQSY